MHCSQDTLCQPCETAVTCKTSITFDNGSACLGGQVLAGATAHANDRIACVPLLRAVLRRRVDPHCLAHLVPKPHTSSISLHLQSYYIKDWQSFMHSMYLGLLT